MTATDKATKRTHAYCPVLLGYQVCLIPEMPWKEATLSNIAYFTDAEFTNRFRKEKE